jgi:transmembrane sensor
VLCHADGKLSALNCPVGITGYVVYCIDSQSPCAMSIKKPATLSIRKQAIQWLIAQNSGIWSSTDQRALNEWLAADEEHEQQYQQVQKLWSSMDAYKEQDFPQRQAALDYQPPGNLDNLIQFPGSSASDPAIGQSRTLSRARREPVHWLKTAMAVAASIVMVLGIQTYRQTSIEHYQTAKGEQQTIFLADGSQIVLNTDSEITIELQMFQRKVQLTQGEALFNVIHNPIRPFEVTVGTGKIRDIGTRFDVYAQVNQVDVAVLEGEVDIVTNNQQSPQVFSAGQAASFDRQGKVNAKAMPSPQALTAWEHGKLIFVEQPLEDVLSQIARYHTVEFQIADPKLRDMKISGSFKTTNLQLLLETLEAGFPIKAKIIDSQHVRLQRASG